MDRELYERCFEDAANEGGYNCNRLVLLDVTGSTNDEVEKLANEGAPEGCLVIAGKQNAGQGRSGRTFISPEGGNLYMSFLIRPSSNIPMNLLTPAAAVATVRGIEKVCSRKVLIKWVNDIYYNDKKICGIIAKAFNIGKPDMYVVIGIGVNVHKSEAVDMSDIPSYGYLFENTENMDEDLIPRLAASIYSEYMDIYYDIDHPDFMEEYKDKSYVIGKTVTYFAGDMEKSIKVCGIDDEGALIVCDEDGNERVYRDGEIRIKI